MDGRERGEEGLFTVQLILDNGAEEYVLENDSDDLEPMLRLFRASDHATFDLERKVLMFGTLKVKWPRRGFRGPHACGLRLSWPARLRAAAVMARTPAGRGFSTARTRAEGAGRGVRPPASA